MIDPQLQYDVAQAEGCRLSAYQDTRGFWTIGYGHKIPAPVADWTQDQADAQLVEDIGAAQAQAETLTEWAALDTACRQNAVVELVFNMGLRKWEAFIQTRDAIERSDWQTAHDQLLNSAWASEVGPDRSSRLANQLLTGAYA